MLKTFHIFHSICLVPPGKLTLNKIISRSKDYQHRIYILFDHDDLNSFFNSWVSAITGIVSLVIMWPGIFYEFSVAQKEQQYLAKKAAGNMNYLECFLYCNYISI